MQGYVSKPVAVLGLGLIGGSLFQRLVRLGHPVAGYDISPATRQLAAQAVGHGSGRVADTLAGALAEAELVVIATPMAAIPAVLDELGGMYYRGMLTDVSSTKSVVDANVRDRMPNARWVGGHPMAGTQHAGFAASSPNLLTGCAWALCLETSTQLSDWWELAHWITALGSRVVPTTAAEHDHAIARISHVPHAVAAALVNQAAAGDFGSLALSLAAGSFRDGTRVMESLPELVGTMCGTNAAALATELENLSTALATFAALLSGPDPVPDLIDWLEEPHRIRSAWPRTDMTSITRRIMDLDQADLLAIGRAGGWIAEVTHENVISVKPKITQKTANQPVTPTRPPR